MTWLPATDLALNGALLLTGLALELVMSGRFGRMAALSA